MGDAPVRTFFEVIGHHSKVVKLLKLVNQEMVLMGTQILKETVLSDIMTKDIRTPDGWRIVIRIHDIVEVRRHHLCYVVIILIYT